MPKFSFNMLQLVNKTGLTQLFLYSQISYDKEQFKNFKIIIPIITDCVCQQIILKQNTNFKELRKIDYLPRGGVGQRVPPPRRKFLIVSWWTCSEKQGRGHNFFMNKFVLICCFGNLKCFSTFFQKWKIDPRIPLLPLWKLLTKSTLQGLS